MNQPGLLAAVALIVISAVAWLSTIVAERRRRGLRVRLAEIVVGTPQSDAQSADSVLLRRPTRTRGSGRLGRLPARFHHHLTVELAATGDRVGIPRLALVMLVGALSAAGLLVAALGAPIWVTAPLALAAGIGAAAFSVRSAQRRFQQRFVDLFPETLDVIVRAVRAGLPVLDAIEAAVGNVSEPVAGEFNRLLADLRIGIDLE